MTDGTIERSADRITLRHQRHLAYPVDAVWRALTEPAQATVWFGGRVDIDLRVGGEYVTHHQSGERVVDHIVRLEPPRLLEHTFWAHLNPEARVTYELEPTNTGCQLTLTHVLSVADLQRAAQSYGWKDPMTPVARSAAGWHHLLDRLEAVLDGGESPAPEPVDDLLPRYQAQLAAGR